MTHWGYLLLAVYVGLGLSPVRMSKAIVVMAVVTLGVIALAFQSYGGL